MTKNTTAWVKTRKFLNDIHLWIGLASGLIVFLVCLSGTIYVFNEEIREAATPELFNVQPTSDKAKIPAAQLIAAVEQNSGGKVVSVKIPADAGRSWQMGVKKEKSPEKPLNSSSNTAKVAKGPKGNEGAKKPSRPIMYYVNPYNAAVLGNSAEIKSGTVTFMTYMFSLHRWLILDKIEKPIFGDLDNRKLGSYISGTATILFTLGVITGMVIWFPRKIRAWKQGLKIKWSGNWKRINHDLHNSLGMYSCIFLFLMGITGPQWSFEWYRTGLRKALGTYQAEGPGKPEGQGKPEGRGKKEGIGPKEAEGTDGRQQLSIEDYHAAAAKVFNFKGDVMIAIPADAEAKVNISKFKAGFFAPAAADKLTLDQASANVVKVERFADMPFNERISGSIKALHIGDVYGMFTKIIYFLACLIATSLPVTGTLIWLNKMKKKKPKRNLALSLDSTVQTAAT
ncbi:PepSY-associated TM helix domain-containing protein [Pedobacter immunditicola]|uniref:PepSY-associated TM helix domain-containing protein n=1 Tax=Pedobacter immunditicola TaxID=3133440 RepID=UPI0030A579DB